MSSLEAGSQFVSAAAGGANGTLPICRGSSTNAQRHGLRGRVEAATFWIRSLVDVGDICRFDREREALGLFDVQSRDATPRYEQLKRLLDLALAAVGVVVTAPLWALVALAICFESRGPILFRQQRVGRNGRRFKMYKFRSMHADAPPYEFSPNSARDARITRVGRLLRRSSLDELPQLINVLKGEMSLVGPRPEMPFVVEQNSAAHEQRLRVQPGMTGLWQLSPARAARIHENLQYDHYYVQNRSLAMDLAILLYTPVFLMRGI